MNVLPSVPVVAPSSLPPGELVTGENVKPLPLPSLFLLSPLLFLLLFELSVVVEPSGMTGLGG